MRRSGYRAASPLAFVLEQSGYRKFLPMTDPVVKACQNGGHAMEDHIEDVLDMVGLRAIVSLPGPVL